MSNRRPHWIAIPLVLLLGALVAGILLYDGGNGSAGNGPKGDRGKVTVRLPIPVVDAAFAPYYLAQDRGIFEKYNLDVKIEAGSPELNPVKMVDAGSDEFGVVGGPELLMSGRAAGASLKGIALLHKDANFPIIISLKASEITRPEHLQDKKIGFFIGHISTDVLRAFLKQEGIDYEEIDVGFNYGPLLSGQLDAEWAFRTTAGLTLPAQGYELNVINPAEYGIVSQGHTIITHERLIAKQPGLVRDFLAAVIEAIEYGLDNPQAMVAATLARDSTLDRNVVAEQVRIYNETIARNSKIGFMDAETMRRDAARQKSLGVLRKSFNVDEAFTNEFVMDYHGRSQAASAED